MTALLEIGLTPKMPHYESSTTSCYSSLRWGRLQALDLHYVSANDLFDFDLKDGSGTEGRDVNPTVCGIHSSDLGQYMIANFYAKFLPPVIASSGKLKA